MYGLIFGWIFKPGCSQGGRKKDDQLQMVALQKGLMGVPELSLNSGVDFGNRSPYFVMELLSFDLSICE